MSEFNQYRSREPETKELILLVFRQDFVDKGTSGPAQKSEVRLREYCDAMLKDIRRSHREREQQLSEAAQTFRNRLQNTVHKYEELLIAYRLVESCLHSVRVW